MIIALRNASIDGRATTLRIAGERILTIETPPVPGDFVVELDGARVLPGLINAHDHLQLNNYPPVRFRELHSNAAQWIEDVDTRRASDSTLLGCARMPREARLLQGALKNLLSGVTTVVHHDPCYAALRAADFPVRVPDYGWSHSLYVDGESAVRAASAATPLAWPWIIHAGEGIDSDAQAEFERLEALGCIRANTLLVHGVAFTARQLARMRKAGATLVWCPASNLYLFGRTMPAELLTGCGAVLLGSDSRLTGSRDLLAELDVARLCGPFDEAALTKMVTREAARVLNLQDRGVLQPGTLADLLILPAGENLAHTCRAAVRAVFVGGVLRLADADFAAGFPAGDALPPVRVDGVLKRLDAMIVAKLRTHEVHEPGFELEETANSRAA